jgi:glycosyltransferase involved in cell wall biosynthesis
MNAIQIAVLIPCHNEQATVGKVVDDFRAALPDARVYVFDNCCTDDTAAIAARHGATVIRECRQGKGFVVESMLDRVEADFYVMVDGDGPAGAGAFGASGHDGGRQA